MSKGKNIAIAVIIAIIVGTIAYFFTVQYFWEEQRKMLEGKATCSDGRLVPQECAILCGTPTLQACIEDANRVPSTIP